MALITSVRTIRLRLNELVISLLCLSVSFLKNQIVFIGMGFGSPVWGNVSDKYGRKIVSALFFPTI